jgi:single-stranded DNA-binding protein
MLINMQKGKTMARENSVRLYGCVADTPQITKDNKTGEYVRGTCHLAVIRSSRYSGEIKGQEERIMYDCPIILSVDQDIISYMSKLKKYDVVDVEGPYVTKKIRKRSFCSSCGEENLVESMICFVMPLFMQKRNLQEYTEKQSLSEILTNREISNRISILGNLCNDVNYYHKDNIQVSTYQIATERKMIIKADSPNNRTDFSIVKSYGRNAKMDSLCIHKGTLVYIDGYIHTRDFERKITCKGCGTEYMTQDSTMELVPYIIEYLRDFTDPDTALKEKAEQSAEKGAALLENLGKR